MIVHKNQSIHKGFFAKKRFPVAVVLPGSLFIHLVGCNQLIKTQFSSDNKKVNNFCNQITKEMKKIKDLFPQYFPCQNQNCNNYIKNNSLKKWNKLYKILYKMIKKDDSYSDMKDLEDIKELLQEAIEEQKKQKLFLSKSGESDSGPDQEYLLMCLYRQLYSFVSVVVKI